MTEKLRDPHDLDMQSRGGHAMEVLQALGSAVLDSTCWSPILWP